MDIKTYVNETEEGWVLTFNSPLLPNYEGPLVTIDEELAREILATVVN